MPKLSDAEKERRAIERAEERAAEAAEKRKATADARFAAITKKLDAKHISRDRALDSYRLFEYMHKMALRGDLDEGLLRIHLRQEGIDAS
jgi:hypothetical protein